MSAMFGRPAVVTASTSMANMAAICTLTTDRDLLLALADEDVSPADLVRGFHREFAGREITLREVGAW